MPASESARWTDAVCLVCYRYFQWRVARVISAGSPVRRFIVEERFVHNTIGSKKGVEAYRSCAECMALDAPPVTLS